MCLTSHSFISFFIKRVDRCTRLVRMGVILWDSLDQKGSIIPPQTCKEKSHLKERIDRTRFNRLYQTNPIHFFFFNPLFFSRCKHIQWTLGDHRSLKRGVKSQKGFTVSKKFNKLFFSFSLIDNGQFMVKGII